MCLVVIGGEIKKRCGNCGGLCKREQMSRITAIKKARDVAVLLQVMQPPNDRIDTTNATR